MYALMTATAAKVGPITAADIVSCEYNPSMAPSTAQEESYNNTECCNSMLHKHNLIYIPPLGITKHLY